MRLAPLIISDAEQGDFPAVMPDDSERQREGIVLAKQRGVYKGHKRALSTAKVTELKEILQR